MVLVSYNNANQIWADTENPRERSECNVKLPPSLVYTLQNESILKELMQVGWIVREAHKWGFLLNLDSISEAYHGVFTERWKRLLQEPFILEIFEKFAYYYDEDEDDDAMYKTTLNREISSTDNEQPLP